MSATVLEHECAVTKFYIQWCTPSIWRQEQTCKQFQIARRKKVFKNQALKGAHIHNYTWRTFKNYINIDNYSYIERQNQCTEKIENTEINYQLEVPHE